MTPELFASIPQFSAAARANLYANIGFSITTNIIIPVFLIYPLRNSRIIPGREISLMCVFVLVALWILGVFEGHNVCLMGETQRCCHQYSPYAHPLYLLGKPGHYLYHGHEEFPIDCKSAHDIAQVILLPRSEPPLKKFSPWFFLPFDCLSAFWAGHSSSDRHQVIGLVVQRNQAINWMRRSSHIPPRPFNCLITECFFLIFS